MLDISALLACAMLDLWFNTHALACTNSHPCHAHAKWHAWHLPRRKQLAGGLWARAEGEGARTQLERRNFGIADDVYAAGLFLAYMAFIPFCTPGSIDAPSLQRCGVKPSNPLCVNVATLVRAGLQLRVLPAAVWRATRLWAWPTVICTTDINLKDESMADVPP